MRRIIWILPVLIWMSVIFWFSEKPADQSSQMSMSVGRIVGEICVRDFGKLPEGEQMEFAERIDHFVRKSAHFTEYTILGILLANTYAAFGMRRWKWFLCSSGSGILYAASDEFHQLFVPGRSGQVSDVLLDGCGVLAGIALILIYRQLIRRPKSSL